MSDAGTNELLAYRATHSLTGMRSEQPVAANPADRVVLNAVDDLTTARRRPVLVPIQPVDLQHLKLQRDRKTVRLTPGAAANHDLAVLLHRAIRGSHKAVDVRLSVRIRHIGPAAPQDVQRGSVWAFGLGSNARPDRCTHQHLEGPRAVRNVLHQRPSPVAQFAGVCQVIGVRAGPCPTNTPTVSA